MHRPSPNAEMKYDKQKATCTYCNRVISIWGGSRELYKHKDQRGQPCRASGTKAWIRL